jgi:hypothetical protein
LSTWSAAQVIAPLSRGNGAHTDRLLRAQSEAQLTTRELRQWFEHYQKAKRSKNGPEQLQQGLGMDLYFSLTHEAIVRVTFGLSGDGPAGRSRRSVSPSTRKSLTCSVPTQDS